ncbi:MAG TPA: hypothetical protein VEH47_01110, partial [Candidatus Acidoferrales bacterium]|nr:hypothetical protein [Candidatus Acidoferrales bacterium]
ETARSVIQSSYYEPSAYLLNPPLYAFVVQWQWLLFPLLVVTCLAYLVFLWSRRRAFGDPVSRSVAIGGLSAAAFLLITLAVHRLMYRLGHILMPLGRRAVFIPPLCTLTIGALLALRLRCSKGVWFRGAALSMLWLTALYFIACLRLTYFMEWKYNLDARQLYSVVAYYNHTYGVQDISANWRYVAVLNFYRALSGRETLGEVPAGPMELAVYPTQKPLYVLHYSSDVPFIGREKLKVVYHNPISDAAVAIRPEIEVNPDLSSKLGSRARY